MADYDIEGWTPKPITIDFTLQDVDPEVLGILTGGVMGTKPEPTFALEVVAPIKRTFWQWLRRKPVQHMRYYIPNATMGPCTMCLRPDCQGGCF